jgi:hypothetical protein
VAATEASLAPKKSSESPVTTSISTLFDIFPSSLIIYELFAIFKTAIYTSHVIGKIFAAF